MNKSHLQLTLTPPVFYILLALAIKERHGYEIMKQVRNDSKEKVQLGPGTLYGAIKRMLEEGLIIETDERLDETLNNERRRYYKLTDLGRQSLHTELERMEDALETAKKGNIFGKLLNPTLVQLAL